MNQDIKSNGEVLMVGLDLTEMDDVIINYLDILLKSKPFSKVFFVHIAKKLEMPDDIMEKYPDLLAPLDESIAYGIEKKVEHLFSEISSDFDVIVQEGSPLENFLRLSKIKNADLIVLGRKKNLKGSGLIAGHIVRRSPASILFVTENFSSEIKNILVPVDFSKHSALAFEAASKFKAKSNSEIRFSHVYSVPSGYYKTGKSYDEFAEIMKGHAISDLGHFLKRNKISEEIPCDYLLSNDEPRAELISNHATENAVDLIVIGSRGRTTSSAILIGSIVEKVLLLDSDIPILIVKNKGENMSFFEAIMKL